jgi:hypothetical protein
MMEQQPVNEPTASETEAQAAPSLLQRLKRSIETTASQVLNPRPIDFDSVFPVYSHHDD